MLILGLDLSNKTGWSILDVDNNKIIHYGLIKSEDYCSLDAIDLGLAPDFQFYFNASSLAEEILKVVDKFKPDHIFIEQTNGSLYRTSQKSLEFIHALVLSRLYNSNYDCKKVHYVDTSQWRSILKIRLNKDQKKHNQKNYRNKQKGIKAKKGEGKITTKHLSVAWVNQTYGFDFKLINNDICDSICLCAYGYDSLNKKEVVIDDKLLDSIIK